jgi:putative transposase
MVRDIREHFGHSEKRACSLVGMTRSSYRYEPKASDDTGLRIRLKALAQKKRRYGVRTLHLLLKKEGLVVNHKRTERIYREEGLALRVKRRKKLPSTLRSPLPVPTRANTHWAIDFIHDSTASGKRFRCLSVLDIYSRECLALRVDTSISGRAVVDTLLRVIETRGIPTTIVADNGPEFTGKAFQSWAEDKKIHIAFIRPGKPIDNAFIESFQGKFRDQCLNEHWFTSLQQARELIEQWRHEYNHERPHRSLRGLTPSEFAEKAVLTG